MRVCYVILLAAVLLLVPLASSDWTVEYGTYPGILTCEYGWDYNLTIYLQNPNSEGITMKAVIEAPVNLKRDSDSIPNLEWVSFHPVNLSHEILVDLPPANETINKTITPIPVYIRIPDDEDNYDAQWQVDILTTFQGYTNDSIPKPGNIQTAWRTYIFLITRPHQDHDSNIALYLFTASISIFLAGGYIYIKRMNRE